MRRILLGCLVTLFTFCAADVLAQRNVTGRVTSAEDGSGLPGVNVVVKGSTSGTVTDADGSYSLSVPEGGNVLVFTFIGLKSQEIDIAGRAVVDANLAADVTQLSEVVVTALGIERNKNELGYAAQQVSGDKITAARGTNFVNSLSGKVSGVDIKASNTMGGSTNVVIRGYKSLTNSNQALFVIDGIPVTNASTNTTAQQTGGVGVDYGNAAQDINPDNIASVNVLKGAAATALYGSRAANGVIMITTKKGRKNSFDVVLNSGLTWGQIDKTTYTKYQKEYGAGYIPRFGANKTFDDGSLPTPVYGDDASYGPKFDGQPVYHWDALDPSSQYYHKSRPWVAAANDPTNSYFETAVTSSQSVGISAGTDKTTYKVGYTRVDEKGMLPNSTIDRNMFNFTASTELIKKMTITTSANYTNIKGVGRYGTGYNGRNPNQGFRQWWQTNVDIKEQREAYFRNRQNVTWNWNAAATGPLYADNPYWSRYENYSNDSRNHFFGYASLNYEITPWLSVLGRAAYDGTQDFQEERVAVGSAGTSSYGRYNRGYSEQNYDLMFTVKKKFAEDFAFTGLVGTNLRRTKTESIRASTNGGLVVPRLYSLSNSLSPINPPTEEYIREGVDGIFADLTLGYKELAYIEGTVRRDQSTALPAAHDSYWYYSGAANFVFSEIIDADWLSNGKLRANYAEVGNAGQPQAVFDVYDKPTGIGSIPLFSLPNTKNNADLKPERTKSWEVGAEADFFDNRLGVDLTYYEAKSLDQILNVTVSGATGYTGKWVNSGEITNKGIEASLYVVPIQTNDFSWTINFNYTRNRNMVVDLYGEGSGEVTNYPLGVSSVQGGVSFNAAKGYPFGVIRGKDFVYTNGERTVNSAGYYQTTTASNVIIGNAMPDWIGGINNSLSYKGVALSFLVDIRKGGNIWSLDQWYGEATGLYPNSVGLNDRGVDKRTPVDEGGGILLPGVQADGSANTVYGEAQDGDGQLPFGYAANGYSGAPHAWYVYDASYVKLREATITYSLPVAALGLGKAFKAIDLSLIGRNLWIIDKKMKYADPEDGLSSGNTNVTGYQSGAYPMLRSYGFNVKLTF
ncbi:SusC/RagA family TonB-linked outer membrane protein [Chryseolinea sp. T2]|uniref:SusC/RagA family TonB-linked outer membrane protein n=1 Tax=Chryseolinea sp. T2 TaxID=3129255 RepID=UPI0030770CE7